MCVLVTQMCSTLCDPVDDTGVVCHFLLQETFPTKGKTQVPCIAGRFFTVSATREAPLFLYYVSFFFYTMFQITWPIGSLISCLKDGLQK